MKLVVSMVQAGFNVYHLGEVKDRIRNFDVFEIHVVAGKKMNRNEFHKAVKFLEPDIDIWQCHNEPDYYVPLVKEVSDKPAIYDVHDLHSIRSGGYCTSHEALSFERCDGILTVGGPLEDICRIKCDNRVFVSSYRTMCPSAWFPELKDPKPGKLVIATGLSSDPGHYRYWLDVFNTLSDRGYEVVCYAGGLTPPDEYLKCKADIRGAVPIPQLLDDMADAEAAIVGFPNQNPLADIANPNKLYEAIAAGLPVVNFGTETYMAGLIKDQDLGVCINQVDELPKALDQAHIYRKGIRERRMEYAMDTQVNGIIEFYKDLL